MTKHHTTLDEVVIQHLDRSGITYSKEDDKVKEINRNQDDSVTIIQTDGRYLNYPEHRIYRYGGSVKE